MKKQFGEPGVVLPADGVADARRSWRERGGALGDLGGHSPANLSMCRVCPAKENSFFAEAPPENPRVLLPQQSAWLHRHVLR